MNHISSCPSLGLYALAVKNPPTNAGDIRDTGSIPGLGRSPGGEHGNTLQYSCLENPMDRKAWLAMVHGVAKSQTILGTTSLAHQERGEGMRRCSCQESTALAWFHCTEASCLLWITNVLDDLVQTTGHCLRSKCMYTESFRLLEAHPPTSTLRIPRTCNFTFYFFQMTFLRAFLHDMNFSLSITSESYKYIIIQIYHYVLKLCPDICAYFWWSESGILRIILLVEKFFFNMCIYIYIYI